MMQVPVMWMPHNRLATAMLAVLLLAAIGYAESAKAAEPSAELKGLQEIAQAFYRAGSYAEALESAEKVLALTIKEFGPEGEQTAIQEYGVGLVAERAGKLADAERHYAASVRIREKVYGPDSPAVTQASAELGSVILLQGRAAEAEPILRRVLALRSAVVGAGHPYTASAHAGLGDVALSRREFPAALAAYRQAIRALTKDEPTQTVVKSLAESEIRRNRDAFVGLARAAWSVRQSPGVDATALVEETFAAGQLAWATSAAAALARMTARLKAGDTDLGRSIRRLQELSDRILALHEEDMAALAAWSAVQRADPTYSRLLDEFRAASIAQGRVNAPIAQQQKGLIDKLQDLLKRCPPGQKAAGCETSDRDREAISKELGALSAEAGKGSQAIMGLNQRMQAAEAALPGAAAFAAERTARLAEQQRRESEHGTARAGIAKAFPEFISLSEPKPLTIAATRALLGPDEALVAMLSGSSHTFVWVVTREHAEWAEVEAGTAALEADVAALRRGLDPSAEATAETATQGSGPTTIVGGFDLARAHALYQKILGRFGPLLADKRHLLLVPTGPLTSLPFQVLVSEPPRPRLTGPDALRAAAWLIRRHALSVLPSVQSLASLRRFASAGAAVQPFLGIGDPILVGPGASDQSRGAKRRAPAVASLYRNSGLADTRAVRELVPLPETADELLAIGKVLGAPRDAILLREKATETRVKATQLRDYRVIQFATHGLIAGDLSGLTEPALVLTPPDAPSEADDGLLTASEIASLKLDADWVVLSACNTAAGDSVGADALSGLARAFFFAGARALLVSHWPVNSAAAVQLTTGAFGALASTPSIGRAEALRRSMLALIDKGQPDEAHPGIWAPFVVVGEGGVRAKLEAAPPERLPAPAARSSATKAPSPKP